MLKRLVKREYGDMLRPLRVYLNPSPIRKENDHEANDSVFGYHHFLVRIILFC
jgi:hypothetical protein